MPNQPHSWKTAIPMTAAVTATRPAIWRRAREHSLTDRPRIILGRLFTVSERMSVDDWRFLRRLRGGCAISRGCDEMAMLYNDIRHCPLHPVLGRELTLFDRSFNIKVVALLVCQCHFGQVSIEA